MLSRSCVTFIQRKKQRSINAHEFLHQENATWDNHAFHFLPPPPVPFACSVMCLQRLLFGHVTPCEASICVNNAAAAKNNNTQAVQAVASAGRLAREQIFNRATTTKKNRLFMNLVFAIA